MKKTRLAWLMLLATAACSSSAAEGKKGDTATSDGPQALEHEKCDDSMGRVEVTGSVPNKPDLKQVFDKTTGRELCRVADLNHDGKPDMYEYYNADGTLRRREGAYDNTDAISEIQIYEGGKLVKRERDTTGQRKVDTWDTYDPATGKLTKRERDNNGDGKVDQWWSFEPNGNVTIAIDKNGDGQPDPNESITVGPNGQAIAPAPSAAAQSAGDAGAAAPPPPPTPPVLYAQPPPDVHAKKKKPGAKK